MPKVKQGAEVTYNAEEIKGLVLADLKAQGLKAEASDVDIRIGTRSGGGSQFSDAPDIHFLDKIIVKAVKV